MKKMLSLLALALCGASIYAQTPSDVETVDLGLPSGTLWANMNLGATSVTEYGNYLVHPTFRVMRQSCRA